MSIKTRTKFSFSSAGGEDASLEWDEVNSRLGMYVGGTEVMRLEAAASTNVLPSRMPVGADVAAAGSVQGDAAALVEGLQVVTGANGTLGVILPTAVAGAMVIIKGTTAGVLKVYPATGAAINAISANGAMSLASGVIPAIFVAKSATQWYTLPLLPS